MNNEFLKKYILNQNDPQAGLDLAYWYINEYNNYSAAITYFLKVAELDNCPINTRYECLMMISHLYQLEGCRWRGAEQYATFAKVECSERPEAYLMYAEILCQELIYRKIFEQEDWLFVYENAKIGLECALKHDHEKSQFYKGIDYLKMYYCLSLLRLNKHDELKTFLQKNKIKSDDFNLINKLLYIYNELKINSPYLNYDKSLYDKLKIQFKGSEKIKQNYSQVMQDMFVLTVLDGKTNGTYIDIGSGDPLFENNTKLLEEFKWSGLSIDNNQKILNNYLNCRKNPILIQDALNTKYNNLFDNYFKNNKTIDYLTMDLDPAEDTLKCLYEIPLNDYKFNIISFKHDRYALGDQLKSKANKILTSRDYILVGENIKYNMTNEFEDWYVHKSIYTPELKQKLDTMFKDANGVVSKIFFK